MDMDMVTKIRRNTFETNSSSTHSLTVVPREINLTEGDIIYPSRINLLRMWSGEDNYILVASTKIEKIIILLHWIKELLSEKRLSEKAYNILESLILGTTYHKKVVWEDDNYISTYYEDEKYFDLDLSDENLSEIVSKCNEYILDIVLNPEVQILESYYCY